MARIRSIKPQFWTSEQIAECSPNVRLLFIGMWNFCDDYGVHPASCARLKMEVFPADPFSSEDVRRMVAELTANGLIVEYEIAGKPYWWVTGWDSHQRPDTRTGLYPRPDGNIGNKIRRTKGEQSPNERRTVADHSPPDKEKEKEKENPNTLAPPAGFAEFWMAYPKKKGKGGAERAWKRLRINGNLPKVLAAVEKQKQGIDWQKEGGKFIPYPEKWLNQKQWEDECTFGGDWVSDLAAGAI